MGILERLYIFFIAFTNAFALTSVLPIPLIILFFLFIRKIFFVKKIYVSLIDYILLIFLFEMLISFFLNLPESYDIRVPFNHLISYFVAIFLMYFFLKQVFLEHVSFYKYKLICKYLFYAVLIVSLFGILEFLLKNFLYFNLDNFIYRPTVLEMKALALGVFYRSRSVVEEPGHFALFLEIFIPLVFYCLLKQSKFFIIFIFIFVVSLFFTFSTASFIIFPFSIFLVFIYNFFINKIFKKTGFYRKIFLIIILVSVLLIIINYLLPLEHLIEYINIKLNDSSSASDRISKVKENIQFFMNGNMLHILFGYGPGAYINHRLEAVISLYFTLLIENGIIGLCIFLFFLIVELLKILSIKSKIKIFLLVSYLNAIFHYVLISNYWYPWFWFLVAFIEYIRFLEKRGIVV